MVISQQQVNWNLNPSWCCSDADGLIHDLTLTTDTSLLSYLFIIFNAVRNAVLRLDVQQLCSWMLTFK